MGLGDVGSYDSEGSGSQTNSNTSQGGSDTGSDTRTKQPHLLVNYYEEEDEWEVRKYPDVPKLEVESKQGSTQLANRFKHLKKIIWSESHYQVLSRNVEEEYGIPLREALLEDPEQAVAFLKGVAQYGNADAPNLNPRCVVCGEEHETLGGNWREVGNSIVCEHHTVTELREHSII